MFDINNRMFTKELIMELAIIGTSKKENEKRVAIYPDRKSVV